MILRPGTARGPQRITSPWKRQNPIVQALFGENPASPAPKKYLSKIRQALPKACQIISFE